MIRAALTATRRSQGIAVRILQNSTSLSSSVMTKPLNITDGFEAPSSLLTPTITKIQTRNMGIFESISLKYAEFTANTSQAAQTQQFDVLKTMMLTAPTFRLEHLYQFLKQSLDAATSTRGKIGAKLLGQEADTTLLARQVQLLESMTFEERLTDKSTTINNAVKQRICQATKSTPHEINELLRTFEQMQDIHRLFVNRAKNGQSLPASQEDLQTMMAEDPQIRAKFRKQMTRRR